MGGISRVILLEISVSRQNFANSVVFLKKSQNMDWHLGIWYINGIVGNLKGSGDLPIADVTDFSGRDPALIDGNCIDDKDLLGKADISITGCVLRWLSWGTRDLSRAVWGMSKGRRRGRRDNFFGRVKGQIGRFWVGYSHSRREIFCLQRFEKGIYLVFSVS